MPRIARPRLGTRLSSERRYPIERPFNWSKRELLGRADVNGELVPELVRPLERILRLFSRVPTGIVRSIRRRHRPKGTQLAATCKQCGAAFEYVATTRPRVYCFACSPRGLRFRVAA